MKRSWAIPRRDRACARNVEAERVCDERRRAVRCSPKGKPLRRRTSPLKSMACKSYMSASQMRWSGSRRFQGKGDFGSHDQVLRRCPLPEGIAGGRHFPSGTEAMDTDTPAGRAIWRTICVRLIRTRTRTGVMEAKARGMRFGRRAKFSTQQIDEARSLSVEGAPSALSADNGYYRTQARRAA